MKSITISEEDYKKLEEASKIWKTSIPQLMPKIIDDELRCAKEVNEEMETEAKADRGELGIEA